MNREVDIYEANGVAVKQIVVAEKGTEVEQHTHPYDHLTLLTNGGVEVWIDGEYIGDFKAPYPMTIRAGLPHKFVTLEDMTVLYCVHNLEKN